MSCYCEWTTVKVVLKLMFREFDVFLTDVSYRSRFKMQNSKNVSPSC